MSGEVSCICFIISWAVSLKITNASLVLFNTLFKRIEEVPTITKEWVGSSSNKFATIAKEDKIKYYKFSDDLNLYGKFLCDLSESLNNCIINIKERL